MTGQLTTFVSSSAQSTGSDSPIDTDGLVVYFWQSNQKGRGVPSNDDNGGYDGVPWNDYSSGTIAWRVSDAPSVGGPTYNTGSRGPLRLYGTFSPAVAAYGQELSQIRYLNDYGGGFTAPIAAFKMAIDSTSMAVHWGVSASYPNAAPDNLYNHLFDAIDAELASTGKQFAVFDMFGGESDAGTDVNTSAFSGNFNAFMGGFRQRFGTRVLVAITLLNQTMSGALTAIRVNTINSVYTEYAGANPTNVVLFNPNGIPLNADNVHYPGDSLRTAGNRKAEVILEKQFPGRNNNFRGKSALLGPFIQANNEPTVRASSGTTVNLLPRSPAGLRDGDMEVLFVATGIANPVPRPSLVDAQGFVEVPNSPVSCSVGTNTQCFAAYTRMVTTSALTGGFMPQVVVSGSAVTDSALIIGLRGTDGLDGNPVTSSTNLLNTVIAVSGSTTSRANCLVLFAQGSFSSSANTVSGSAVNSGASGSVSEFTLERDSTDNTNQCISFWSGRKTTPGATGNVTGTRLANTMSANICLVFKPTGT